ncbi:hypothetical protein J2Z30_009754 [Streptomyces iranensis]|uniref:Uncharacterized protein n=1 Tax=Streptomyces iranensis TaxID=576784 RepID=A0ABS4NBA7_9ACTN|nr:hypothetical protein [Streptomyces iranensis]
MVAAGFSRWSRISLPTTASTCSSSLRSVRSASRYDTLVRPASVAGAGRLQDGRVHVDADHRAVRPDRLGEQHAHVARAAADVQHPHTRGDPSQAEQVRAVRSEDTRLKLEPLGLGGRTAHHIAVGHVPTRPAAVTTPYERPERLKPQDNKVMGAAGPVPRGTPDVSGRQAQRSCRNIGSPPSAPRCRHGRMRRQRSASGGQGSLAAIRPAIEPLPVFIRSCSTRCRSVQGSGSARDAVATMRPGSLRWLSPLPSRGESHGLVRASIRGGWFRPSPRGRHGTDDADATSPAHRVIWRCGAVPNALAALGTAVRRGTHRHRPGTRRPRHAGLELVKAEARPANCAPKCAASFSDT